MTQKRTSGSRGPFVGAAELMRTQPDLIVATGPEVALQAIVGASSHTPVVMLAVNFDPFERGYVASLAQPGGNITGVVVRPIELARKQIDLLKQTFPDRARVAMLYDVQTADQFAAANQAARSLNLQVQAIKLEIPSYDFVGAFQAAADGKAQLMMVLSSTGFASHGQQLAELAIKHAHHVYFSALRRCRRTNVLWRRISADVAANRGLCRANFKGRETY
jgi:putative tryptophan/tyrosine transport system substrate-binding protein